MYKVGVVPGKFLPPHRGHLHAIINAATRAEKIYVVVSDNRHYTKKVCEEEGLRLMDLKTRAKWLSIELQNFDHIEVLMLDESNIPEYPHGWEQWSKLLIDVVPEPFDVIFGGERDYIKHSKEFFPFAEYVVFDHNRTAYPISATQIRKNPYKNWDYILGSARSHFAKRVLITGTESCAKTTMTKYLGKLFHTSWTEEEGRYYSERFLGGNEDVFTIEDFDEIVLQQHKADLHALKTANRIVFFDTDAVVTQFYAGMYLDDHSEVADTFAKPEKYDLILMFKPDVKWVDDGLRWNSDDEKRKKLHEHLLLEYHIRGFKNIVEVSGNYNERLNKALLEIKKIMKTEMV